MLASTLSGSKSAWTSKASAPFLRWASNCCWLTKRAATELRNESTASLRAASRFSATPASSRPSPPGPAPRASPTGSSG
eukprot:3103234-Lingulodinium_polyedra.AAC.1